MITNQRVAHSYCICVFFFFQAEDGIRDVAVTGVQTCALPIYRVRDVGLAACASPGQLGLRLEHLRAQERQPEREETCTHLILLVVVALTSRRTRRIPRAGTRSPCIPDRGGCRSWRYSIPARSTP